MFELLKINNYELKELNVNNKDEVYALKKDNQILGYGIISDTKENKVEFSILKKYRGTGHGKIIFKLLKDKLKDWGYKEITITIPKENIPARNIIESQNGLLIPNNKDNMKYVINLR